MRTLKLWPLSVAEVKKAPVNRIMDWAMQNEPKLGQVGGPEQVSRHDYIDFILEGGFPEVRELPIRSRQRQYRDYIDAVVERDVADIMPVRKPDALRILIDQMAARSAQEINTSELSKLTKLQRVTVDQYLDILLRLSMLTKLGAWTSGEGGQAGDQEPKIPFCRYWHRLCPSAFHPRYLHYRQQPAGAWRPARELCSERDPACRPNAGR